MYINYFIFITITPLNLIFYYLIFFLNYTGFQNDPQVILLQFN